MKTQTVTGGGGIKLHVAETGNPQGRPILFIHGFSQCGLCWKKQMESDLANDFRLVALDIRGHGLSDKPQGAYGDTQLWADDVNAVITELALEKPVLVGWSYGGVLVCDYLRHYGDEKIGGINFIGAASKLGEPLFPFLNQNFVDLAEGFFSNVVEESVAALEKFMRLIVYKEPSREDFYFWLGFNTIVPPYVRAGLFDRSVDSDEVLSQIRIPALMTHGEEDVLVHMTMAEHHQDKISNARVSTYPGVGHAPFWESPERFNSELGAFAASI